MFVGYLADVLVAEYNHWREGSHQVERPAGLGAGYLGVSKLLSFPRGANVAVQEAPSNVISVPSRLRRISRLYA